MKKLILGLATGAAAVAVTVAGAGMASADVSDNGNIKDAHGFGVTNHIHNNNGDHNGVGWIRSEQTGAQISAQGGFDGAVAADPNTVAGQGSDNDGESLWAPISNKGGKKG
jgi:hypothetical protein